MDISPSLENGFRRSLPNKTGTNAFAAGIEKLNHGFAVFDLGSERLEFSRTTAALSQVNVRDFLGARVGPNDFVVPRRFVAAALAQLGRQLRVFDEFAKWLRQFCVGRVCVEFWEKNRFEQRVQIHGASLLVCS